MIGDHFNGPKGFLKGFARSVLFRPFTASIASRLPIRKLPLAKSSLKYGYGGATSAFIRGHFSNDSNISRLLAIDHDRNISPTSSRFPTETLSDRTLRNLIEYELSDLSRIEALLNSFGFLHVGAILRTCLLINITKRHASKCTFEPEFYRACIEILGSDYAQEIIFSRDFLAPEYRTFMSTMLKELAGWPRDKRLAVFVEPDLTPESLKVALISGSTTFLQGPSVRQSNLAPSDSDLVCATGFSGRSSMPAACDRVDISLYRQHKLKGMLENDRIHELNQLRLAVLTSRSAESWFSQDQRRWFQARFHTLESRVQAQYCESTLNAGIELLIFLFLSGAARVSVANVDLFLNRRYPDQYLSNRPKTQIIRQENSYNLQDAAALELFKYHSPGQQLAVLKFFSDDSAVVYDDVLSEIVSMSLSAYTELLEKTYRRT